MGRRHIYMGPYPFRPNHLTTILSALTIEKQQIYKLAACELVDLLFLEEKEEKKKMCASL